MNSILNIIKKIIPQKIFKKLQPTYHFLLSWLSAFLYKNPSENLIVIGVTGTTGKTTSSYLIAKTLQQAGYKVGFTTTAMFGDGEKEWLNDKKMTMVGRFFTQKILKKMVKNNCQYAIIETTSEGVRQFRHRFINYDVLVFTGLYPEHIESHGGFENYKKAKGELFKHFKRCKTKYVDDEKNVKKVENNIKKIDLNRVKKTTIANFDDEHADYFLDFWAERKIAYSQDNIDNKENIEIIKYSNIQADKNGLTFKINNEKINLQILGDFNAGNAMTAICVGLSQDLALPEIKQGVEKIKGIDGRLEKIDEGQDFNVIVDYAFEPKALTSLYDTVKNMTKGKVINVLGSTGGGRDKGRRGELGKIAGEKADYVIVTNEDPYDDDPQLIIEQVAAGAEYHGKKVDKDLFKISDRREAIAKALSLAKKDDIVLITGKGCEQAICVENGKKIDWDDRIITREELKKIFKSKV